MEQLVKSIDHHFQASLPEEYDIAELEPEFIQNCKDEKKLKSLLAILRSGKEGVYPHLEQRVMDQLAAIDPNKYKMPGKKDLMDFVDEIEYELKEWEQEQQHYQNEKDAIGTDIPFDDLEEKSTAIRNQKDTIQLVSSRKDKPKKPTEVTEKKSLQPLSPTSKPPIVPNSKEYWEKWNSINITDTDSDDSTDNEDEKDNSKETNLNHAANGKQSVSLEVQKDTSLSPNLGAELTPKEAEYLCQLERQKGNEAFRAKDYNEAVTYYSRSISLKKNTLAFLNRAAVYLKQENWKQAEEDATSAIDIISKSDTNITRMKAYYRRATARKALGLRQLALEDATQALSFDKENDHVKKLVQKLSAKKSKLMISESSSKSATTILDENKPGFVTVHFEEVEE